MLVMMRIVDSEEGCSADLQSIQKPSDVRNLQVIMDLTAPGWQWWMLDPT